MAEPSILFDTREMRAVLDGHKTVARRVIDPQPATNTGHVGEVYFLPGDARPSVNIPKNGGYAIVPLRCPHGEPGQRAWVRETWARMLPKDPRTGDPMTWTTLRADPNGFARHVAYAVDAPDFEWCDGDGFATRRDGWKAATTMPRWASRVTLEVTAVRAERLQDISEVDAEREMGLRPHSLGNRAHAEFAAWWDEANRGRGRMLSRANPWVWVVSFKVVEVAKAQNEGVERAESCGT